MISLIMNRFRPLNFITNSSTKNLFRCTTVNYLSILKTAGETTLNNILKNRFPNARLIDVKDTSCKYIFYSMITNILSY